MDIYCIYVLWFNTIIFSFAAQLVPALALKSYSGFAPVFSFGLEHDYFLAPQGFPDSSILFITCPDPGINYFCKEL